MSKIITGNYINKLNELIVELEQSTNLTFLVNFFEEQVQKDQIRKGSKNKNVFSANKLVKLREIKDSVELRRIFVYTNIIFKAFTGQYLHIHINADLSENLVDNIITLFAWEASVNSSYDKDFLDNEINFLKIESKRDIIMPNDNNGHATNQIFRKRYGIKHKLKFIEQIKSLTDKTANNGLLLNLNTSANSYVNLSEYSIFPESLYTFVNFGNSRKDIFKEMGREKVERLSTIINLFPSITGKNIWYKDFMSDEISRYNNFKKIITITSGEKTPEALLEMQKQKKFQAEEIYTIFSFEL
jgi:hypothetical protein